MLVKNQSVEMLEVFLRHSPVPKLISGPKFEIYWANDEFLEWSHYTLSELQELGWRKLSVDDDSLKADITALQSVLDGYSVRYTCQKQYTPKNDKPAWGDFTAIRYPASGEIECFLCTFIPLKNGTAAAFNMAIDHIKDCRLHAERLAGQIEVMNSRDPDEDWFLSTFRVIKRYPKIALFLAMTFLSVIGANGVLELLQRLYAVGVPVPPSVQQTDALQMPAANQQRVIAARWESRDEVADEPEITVGQAQ